MKDMGSVLTSNLGILLVGVLSISEICPGTYDYYARQVKLKGKHVFQNHPKFCLQAKKNPHETLLYLMLRL